MKIFKIAHNSAATKAGEKLAQILESLEFWKFFYEGSTKFKNNQILLNKISHKFLLTTKLFTE
jgi:hypothetical protein